MLSLIEEFKQDATIFILVKNTKDFLYGEYHVVDVKYRSMNNQYAKLALKVAPKKQRYFKPTFEFDGFHIEFKNHSNQEYLVFETYDDLVREFCNILDKNGDYDSKLFKKFKKLYPQFFKFKHYDL
jgi:hypothetical protein